jgi:signal transduction histidine kinase
VSTEGSLKHRLGRAFLRQAIFISIAAILGVYAAGLLLEDVLIRRALKDEAAYFWSHRAKKADFPTPDTHNLTAYLARSGERQEIPELLRALDPGFHDLPSSRGISLAYVNDRDGQRLYLVFDGQRVRELAIYFGLGPLAVSLVVLYLSTWMGYLISRRAVSPVIWLAREVQRLDPQAPHASAFSLKRLPADANEEVHLLATSICQFALRLDAFVERERNFTRDASHELRSPITVIKMAADLLVTDSQLPDAARELVQRIQRSARDMEELMEALLLMARESEQGFSLEPVCVNDLVAEELERARLLLGAKPVEILNSAECRLTLGASDKVLSVLVGNLLRNAFSYTDAGRVAVTISTQRQVIIEDSGIGIPQQQVQQVFKPYFRAGPKRRGGHGVGLTIVKRLCDRFGWQIEVQSRPGRGTRVTLRFPDARCEPLSDTQ